MLKKIIHIGLEEPYSNVFHSSKVKVLNLLAVTLPIFIFSPILLFYLGLTPTKTYPSITAPSIQISFILFCVLILFFNKKKKFTLAQYILTIGFSLLLLLSNITSPGFQGTSSLYIIISAACGHFFDSKFDKILTFSVVLSCSVFSSCHIFWLDLATIDYAFTQSMYRHYLGLVFFHIVSSIIGFLFLHIQSTSIIKNEQLLKTQNQLLANHQTELEIQLEKIQNLEAQRKNYFSNTAHELKTPLTLIMGHTNYLLKNRNLAAKKSLESIQKNANRLYGFVNQILDLIKSNNSTIPLKIVQFQLPDLINSVIDDFDSYASHKNIILKSPIYTPDIKIISDAEKLSIILSNLLSNAFKYTPQGGSISLSVMDLEASIQVIVQDTGKGIKKEDIDHIFERYFQTSSVNQPLLGGTGIGLTICKKYINLLGGTIQVNSQLGKGSTFTITFLKRMPLEANSIIHPYDFNKKDANTTNKEVLETKNSPIHKKHILIVEDNLELCDFLRTILETTYKLSFAHNGEEALNYLQKEQPDLILTDVMMPFMDGIQLLTRLKEDDLFRSIPVLMLTAKTDLSTQTKALRIGVDDYLAKPFDSEVLKAHLHNLFVFSDNHINNKLAQKNTSDTIPIDEPKNIKPTLSRDDQAWLEDFETIVMASVTDIHLNLDKIANKMAISTTHLHRKVNTVLGISPKRYVREVRLLKARKMLEEKEYNSVKAVAYSVGFKSEKVFSRNFKARFGKYPSEYLS